MERKNRILTKPANANFSYPTLELYKGYFSHIIPDYCFKNTQYETFPLLPNSLSERYIICAGNDAAAENRALLK